MTQDLLTLLKGYRSTVNKYNANEDIDWSLTSPVQITLEGFIEWLETGEVSHPNPVYIQTANRTQQCWILYGETCLTVLVQ